jgi:major vault protein
MIYFPREEHAIVKYDKSEIHYAIAIPAGEARYVLDRNRGTVSKIEGPLMFLPDPREQVIVRRILPFRTCSLLYPNNMAACAHNAKLAGVDIDTYMSHHGAEVVSAAAAAAPAAAMNFLAMADYEASSSSHMMREAQALGSSADSRGLAGRAGTKAAGDAIQRKNKYTEPRSIVLSTKYDGAVAINVYTGYAVLLVKSDGSRRVVQGPQTVLLDYDETPEILELSTGKPKTTDNMFRTAYLRTTANKVGDVIEVDTADHCKFQVKLSYRMDFTGDKPELWFAVENYVKFLCDNMRSRLKNSVRKVGVEQFYADSTDIIRRAVLKEAADGTFGPRLFQENGMQVYDVEVLMVKLVDQEIEGLIAKSQRAIIQTTIAIANQRRTLDAGKEEESIKTQMAEVRAETNRRVLELEAEEAERKKVTELVKINAQAAGIEARLAKELAAQTARNLVSDEARKNDQAHYNLEAAQDLRRQELKITMIQAEIKAVVDKAGAITPELIAALQAFGDNALVMKAAEAMAPLAILGGNSVGDVLSKLLSGTKLGTVAVAALTAAGGNGNGSRDART